MTINAFSSCQQLPHKFQTLEVGNASQWEVDDYIGGRAKQVVFVRGFDRLPVPVYFRGIYIFM
ncbi:hypothetical protein N0B28_14390 [Pseudomonas sp. SD17-1]|uniref:hypothetical protein n=1 Tax=Pseudomonas TaxID=286 RepID=UPI0023DAE3AE|nr:hypothetical protein [Pseudomonas sp. SD17-1]WEJ19486.1 hypothetical protein N0B28_14390 [Pseudomonas sp. SD17-1]